MPSAVNTNEPAAADSIASEPRSSADITADAALALAALGRIQTAAISDRATIQRLRESLTELAEAIARSKAAVLLAASDAEAQLDTAALLDQFDHHVDAMIEIAGGMPTEQRALEHAPQTPVEPHTADGAQSPEPAEPDHVPTVSAVVTGLGHGEVASEATIFEPTAEQSTNVAMLKAMVEALNASVPQVAEESQASAEPQALPVVRVPLAAETPPLPEAASSISETSLLAVEPASPEAADPIPETPSATVEPISPEPVASASEIPPVAVEAASPAPVAPAAETPSPAAELTSPEAVASAVEVSPAVEPSSPEADIPSAAPPDPAPLPVLIAAPVPGGGIAMAELLASYQQMEARPIPPPEEGTAVIFAPRAEPTTTPEVAADRAPVPSPAPASQIVSEQVTAEEPPTTETVETSAGTVIAPPALVVTPVEAAEPAPTYDTEFDPTDFLFGPSPEPDPAAFLLEPSLPQPDTGSAAATNERPVMATPVALETQPVGNAVSALPSPPVKPDPLAPLNAMSEAERLAIFS